MASLEIGSLRSWVQRRKALAMAALLAAAWFLLGGRQGLFALVMGQREKADLRGQIAFLAADNARLGAQAAQLAGDPSACEKTARERLQLMRPGEIIYRFQ